MFTPVTKTGPRQEAAQKKAALAMDGSAALKVAGTGSEQPAFRAGNPGVAVSCDAKCDAISADRIELLTRDVILVAGMDLAEAERAAVLARAIADLASQTTRIQE